MSTFSAGNRVLVSRVWDDIEPKLQAMFASGAVVEILVSVLAVYGITLPSPVVGALVLLAGVAAGYIKKSHPILPPAPTPAPRVGLPGAAEVPVEVLPTDQS